MTFCRCDADARGWTQDLPGIREASIGGPPGYTNISALQKTWLGQNYATEIIGSFSHTI
jgi:hypothetical protein